MSAVGTTSEKSLANAADSASHRGRSDVFKGQLNRYLEVLRWIIGDSIWRYRWRVLVVIASGLLGMSLQIGALALALHYAHVLEVGTAYPVFGQRFMPQDSRALLIGFAALILLGLLASACLVLVSRMNALRLRRNYEEFCCGRAFRLAAAQVGWRVDEEDLNHGDHKLMSIARREARQCGRVFILLMTLVVPAITTIAAVTVLFVQNWLLSVVVLGLTLIAGLFLYRANRHGALSSRRMERHSPQAGMEMKQIVSWIRFSTRRILATEGWFEKELFGGGHTRDFFDAYEDRITAGERTDFISNLLLAIAVFAIMITFGLIILQDHTGWGRLIVYLIALRYALVNFSNVNRRLVGFSRLYPHVRRYYRFVMMNSEATPASSEHETAGEWTLSVPVGSSPIALRLGDRLAVASDVRCSRFTVPDLLSQLLADSRESRHVAMSMSIVSMETGLLPNRPLWQTLGYASAPSGKLSERLRSAGIDVRTNGVIDELVESSSVGMDAWRALDDKLLGGLILLAAVDSSSRWILVDSQVFSTLGSTISGNFLGLLSNRIVIVAHHHRTHDIGSHGEKWVAVLGDANVRWIGTLQQFQQDHHRISKLLPKADGRMKPDSAADLDPNEEDDDL